MSPKHMLLASALTLGLASQAQAADATDDQAHLIAGKLRGFLGGLMTDRVPVPPELVTVTPAGDGYSIVIAPPGSTITPFDATGAPTRTWLAATVRPESDTRWHIETLTLPSALRRLPETAAAARSANPTAPPLRLMEWRIGAQSASGVLDTALASESALAFKLDQIEIDSKPNVGAGAESHTKIGHLEGRDSLRPGKSGGMDYRTDATIDGYSMVSANPAVGSSVHFVARRIVARTDTASVKIDQVGDLVRSFFRLGFAMNAAANGPNAPAERKQAGLAGLHEIIPELNDIMSGMKLEETFEGVQLTASRGSGSADRIRLSVSGDAPGDRFGAVLEVKADGLKIDHPPPGTADFMPHSFLVRAAASNIDLKGLTAWLADAAAPGADKAAAGRRFSALMTGGAVNIRFEHMDADLGYARMTGSGEATIVGPHAIRGSADIEVTGFDSLMSHAAQLPNPARSIPALALVKGFGKTQGDRTTWHIDVYPDHKVLVNGVDVTGLGRH